MTSTPRVDPDPIVRRAIHGYTDPLALVIVYNFGLNDLSSTLNQATPSEPLRTVYHETTHLIQSLGTSYGQFLTELRTLQTLLVSNIINKLRHEYDLPVKQPIAKYISGLKPAARYEDIRTDLYLWQTLEVLYAFLEGDWVYYETVTSRPPFYNRSPEHLFDEMCGYTDWYYKLSSRGIDTATHFDFKSASSANVRATLAWKGLLDIDVRNVLEAAGTASEFIEDGGAASRGSNLPSRYAFFVDLYLHDHPSIRRSEFATTFLALSDLALNGALLVSDGAFRSQGGNFSDLHPLSRMFSAITAAKKLPPIRNFDHEYLEFIAQVSDRCGWATPQQMSRTRLDQLVERGVEGTPGEHLGKRYRAADVLRDRCNGILLDPRFWFGGSAALSPVDEEYLMENFTPPIMTFSDGARLGHADKAYVYQCVISYMIADYLRKVFVRREVEVDIPYVATPEESETFHRGLLQALEDGMRIERPNMAIRTRQASFIAGCGSSAVP